MNARLRDLAREWHEKTDDRNGHGYYTDAETCGYCNHLTALLERVEGEALERAAADVRAYGDGNCEKFGTAHFCESFGCSSLLRIISRINCLKGGSNE